MTYAEYLKSQGASDEEIKILDTAIGRRSFDALQAKLSESDAAREAAVAATKSYEERATKWHDEVDALYLTEKNKRLVAEANEAKARTAILKAQELGLVDIAKDLGYEVVPPNGGGGTPPADPNKDKYITADQLVGHLKPMLDQAGDALASMEDMVAEHMQLFPNQRLNVRQLRKDAMAAGKTIHEFWETKYKVPEARAAAEKATTDAREKALREEGAAAERTRLADTYGNPAMRPLVPSVSPFTKRAETGRDKQPWETNDLSGERVARVTKKIVEQQTSGVTH
jgi:hypothetical protein